MENNNTSDTSYPQISVLVAVYNVEKYLRECLNSLSCQTFELVEFIVIDDASTDNCGFICDEYALTDSRFRVIHKTVNEGTLQSRKRAISEAQGKWIIFLDGDDFLTSAESLKTLYHILEHENVDILKFDVDILGGTPQSNTGMLNWLGQNYECLYDGGITKACYSLNRSFGFNLWNKAYRANILKNSILHCKDDYLNAAEDAYLFFLFSYFADTYKSIKTGPLYTYRKGTGISTMPIKIQNFDGYAKEIIVVDWIKEFLESQKQLEQYNDQVSSLKKILTNTAIGRLKRLPIEDRAQGFFLLAKYHEDETLKQLYLDTILLIQKYEKRIRQYEQKEIDRQNRRNKKLHRRIARWFKQQKQRIVNLF